MTKDQFKAEANAAYCEWRDDALRTNPAMAALDWEMIRLSFLCGYGFGADHVLGDMRAEMRSIAGQAKGGLNAND